MIYPEAFDGSFKAKIFAKNGADDVEIINKEAKIETSDLGDGYKKAVVTVKILTKHCKDHGSDDWNSWCEHCLFGKRISG